MPHDPDLENEPSEIVRRFRAECAAAAGVLFSVPEYAFGIPGSFKNALDWTVGSGSFYRKPVTLLSVAPSGRGEHLRVALDLVLTAIDADVVHQSLPVAPGDRDEHGEITNPRLVDQLGRIVAELADRASIAPVD